MPPELKKHTISLIKKINKCVWVFVSFFHELFAVAHWGLNNFLLGLVSLIHSVQPASLLKKTILITTVLLESIYTNNRQHPIAPWPKSLRNFTLYGRLFWSADNKNNYLSIICDALWLVYHNYLFLSWKLYRNKKIITWYLKKEKNLRLPKITQLTCAMVYVRISRPKIFHDKNTYLKKFSFFTDLLEQEREAQWTSNSSRYPVMAASYPWSTLEKTEKHFKFLIPGSLTNILAVADYTRVIQPGKLLLSC